jgi:hypothetical protein
MATAAFLAMPAMAAAPAVQFNLNCSGTFSARSLYVDKTEPYSSVYRIDLAAGKWCEADCKALHDIASVQPTQITLTEKKVDTPSEKSQLSNVIDRETGEHRILSLYSSPRDRRMISTLNWKGSCEPAPFSGFPSFDTKF